ncbi:glycosyltransferase family 2 protein [Priestia flexa]|uniref:glycosyltransferase family 2 protein n=1 Tax=Priestia flexa TaxID=86664 RepID=UPI00249148DB|nr:glycosyltransferase [Priestia flexa]
MPQVSIVIPTYNSKNTLESTIYSCLNQTYYDIEIIIIDDGSTDDTLSLIKSINDQRLRYYYFKNQGRSAARNEGIKKSRGKYLQFLDSDDTLERDKIARAISILEHDLDIDAVQCGTNYVKNTKVTFKLKAENIKNITHTLLRENIFPIHSVVFKKELASSFPKGLSYCEDWYFWAKTLLTSRIFFQTDYFGANVNVHDSNTMSDYNKMLLGELYILLRLKKEIKVESFARDLKIVKQYLNYSIKYNQHDLLNFDLTPEEVFPFLKYIKKLMSLKLVKNCIRSILRVKGKVLSRKQMY